MIRRRGRVYVKGTAEGFQRMRDRGIPQPSLRREDLLARTVAIEYEELFRGLIEVAASAADRVGMKVDRTDRGTVIVNDASPTAIIQALMDLMGERGLDVERIRRRLNIQLVESQRKFLTDLIDDADPMTVQRLQSMSLPSAEVFSTRLRDLRELYLDGAVERIRGEGDWLKRSFLKKLTDWAEGRTKELHVTDLVDRMKATSAHRARFFARDQFSRFNRSLLVATYTQVEAPYIEWLTCRDERVRPEHEARDRMIYTRQALLADPEWQAYNCRCGFAPLYELTSAQELRLVA